MYFISFALKYEKRDLKITTKLPCRCLQRNCFIKYSFFFRITHTLFPKRLFRIFWIASIRPNTTFRISELQRPQEDQSYHCCSTRPQDPEENVTVSASCGRIRVHFKCLNDFIACGPVLQHPLPAVVIRFREGAIAWSAGVGAMFSRIRLKERDRPYHRFQWPENDGSILTF